MKLAIATPFYEIKGYAPYIESLFYTQHLLLKSGIECIFIPRVSDSYVDRAKNALLMSFYESDCDKLLLIDSDLEWTPDDVVRMMKHDVDLVCGTYPAKGAYEQYCGTHYSDSRGYPKVDVKTGLIDADFVPSGFMLISRSCVERLFKAYECCTYYNGDVKQIALFETCAERFAQYRGEDKAFCMKWLQIGGKIWLEPNLSLTHWGIQGWKGNYHEYLIRQPKHNEV
jgi:hypothetical protein